MNIIKNNLVISEIKTGINEIQPPVCLMGLINVDEKDSTKLQGWILIISGDPLIPIQPGVKYYNRISISRLHLTPNQENAIIHSSVSQDRYAYLYTGMFSIRNLLESGNPHWDWITPNILGVLSSHMSKNILKRNMKSVLTLTEKHIIRRVIKPKKAIRPNGNPSIGNATDKIKETLKFRYTGNQIVLELECPTNHGGYHVGIIFFETFIYANAPDLAENKGRSTTYLRAQADVQIPPCVITHSEKNAVKEENDFPGGKVILTVKKFQMPVYPKDWEQEFVDERKVCCVEYRGIAHLIKDGNWENITVEKLIIKRFQQKATCKQNAGPEPSSSSRISESMLQKGSSENAVPNSDTVGFSETCSQCKISTNVVVMEVELVAGKREVDRASSL